MEPSTSAAIQNFAIPYLASLPAVSAFLAANPTWNLCFYSAVGLFGVYMAYNQDEVNAFIEFIRDNPEQFTEEIVQTDAFKKGFLVTFEAVLKTRHRSRMEVIKRIFLGFTASSDKDAFELERMYRALSSISVDGVEYLRFIVDDIFPLRDTHIDEESDRLGNASNPYDKDYWVNNLLEIEPISRFIKEWIHNEYDANSQKVKDRYGYDALSTEEEKHTVLDQIYKAKRPKEKEYKERMSELTEIGILRMEVQDHGLGSIGGGSINNAYFITKFGNDFINYIRFGQD